MSMYHIHSQLNVLKCKWKVSSLKYMSLHGERERERDLDHSCKLVCEPRAGLLNMSSYNTFTMVIKQKNQRSQAIVLL